MRTTMAQASQCDSNGDRSNNQNARSCDARPTRSEKLRVCLRSLTGKRTATTMRRITLGSPAYRAWQSCATHMAGPNACPGAVSPCARRGRPKPQSSNHQFQKPEHSRKTESVSSAVVPPDLNWTLPPPILSSHSPTSIYIPYAEWELCRNTVPLNLFVVLICSRNFYFARMGRYINPKLLSIVAHIGVSPSLRFLICSKYCHDRQVNSLPPRADHHGAVSPCLEKSVYLSRNPQPILRYSQLPHRL